MDLQKKIMHYCIHAIVPFLFMILLWSSIINYKYRKMRVCALFWLGCLTFLVRHDVTKSNLTVLSFLNIDISLNI